MKNKNISITFVGALAFVMLLGAGCEKPIVKNETQMEMTVNADKAMTGNETATGSAMNMTGVMMRDGVMMSEREDGNMVKMDHDITLKDGTQVMMNGEVMKKDGAKMMMKEGDGMMMDGTMMAHDAMNMPNNGLVAVSSSADAKVKGSGMMNDLGVASQGIYADYTPEKLTLAENKKVVLFFKASWCPTCQAVDKNIVSSKIPSGLAILKVDYDSSFELKKKYGVTIQHTFVQVDKNGNMIKKWIGGGSLADIQLKLN